MCIENWIVNYSQLYNQRIGAGFRVGKSSGAVPLALSRSAFDFRSSAVSPKRGFYLPKFMLLNYLREKPGCLRSPWSRADLALTVSAGDESCVVSLYNDRTFGT